jgi:hypothetical protein
MEAKIMVYNRVVYVIEFYEMFECSRSFLGSFFYVVNLYGWEGYVWFVGG